MADEIARGSLETITEITDFLHRSLELYIKEKGPIDSLDIFMAAHNFHKIIVDSVAKQIVSYQPYEKTLRAADMTFRQAIRELRLPRTVNLDVASDVSNNRPTEKQGDNS